MAEGGKAPGEIIIPNACLLFSLRVAENVELVVPMTKNTGETVEMSGETTAGAPHIKRRKENYLKKKTQNHTCPSFPRLVGLNALTAALRMIH